MFLSRKKRRLLLLPALLLAAVAGLFLYSLRFDPAAEDLPGQRVALAQRERVERAPNVDAQGLLADARTLAAPAMEGRAVGTPGGQRARDYLLSRFRAAGLEPFGESYEQPFQYTPGRGVRFWRAKFWQTPQAVAGVNLVGRIRGSVHPEKVLVISAHYDHLGVRDGQVFHGADDNASGTAALLALASHFRAHPPRHTLVFAAFDAEERGLRGARAFMAQPPVPAQSIRLNINMDMVSRSGAGEIVLSGLYANPQLQSLLDPVRAAATPTLLYGHDHPRPFWNMDDWTGSSDHGVFHELGIPFLYLGVEDHPDYHRPGDTFENIDQPFFISVANMAVDLVAALDAAKPGALEKQP